MSINLHQLKLFHAVARSGSFSRAAAELSISQPSVSIQVGELERQLGVDLFEQAGKSIRLTEAGRTLDDYARQILALVEETRRAIDEVKGMQRGRLRVGATPTPGTYVLPGLLGRFKERHPRLEIGLQIDGPRRIQEMVLRHELDLGVVAQRVTFPDLVKVPMATDEMVLVVSPAHRFAAASSLGAGPGVNLADLSGEPFILRERGSENRETVDDALHRAGVHITPVMELDGAEMVKQAVAANLGVSILSRCAIALEMTAGLLRIVPVRGLRIQRTFSIISHRDRRLHLVAQAFVEMATSPASAAAASSPDADEPSDPTPSSDVVAP